MIETPRDEQKLHFKRGKYLLVILAIGIAVLLLSKSLQKTTLAIALYILAEFLWSTYKKKILNFSKSQKIHITTKDKYSNLLNRGYLELQEQNTDESFIREFEEILDEEEKSPDRIFQAWIQSTKVSWNSKCKHWKNSYIQKQNGLKLKYLQIKNAYHNPEVDEKISVEPPKEELIAIREKITSLIPKLQFTLPDIDYKRAIPLAAVLLLTILGVFWIPVDTSITGLVAYDSFQKYDHLNLSFNRSQTYELDLEEGVTSFAISGELIGSGSAKIFLVDNGTKHLILDSRKIIGPDTATSTSIDSTIKDPIIVAVEGNKSIFTKLTFKDNTPYDTDNNGQESVTGIVDVTVENSEFSWQVEQSNLCTIWEILPISKTESTLLCNGNTQCCTIADLAPTEDSWNSPLYLYKGLYDSTETNTVAARVLYVEYNTSLEVISSEADSKTVSFREESESFVDICEETCLMDRIGNSNLHLEFELDNSEVDIHRIKYTVDTPLIASESPPIAYKDIPDINLVKDTNFILNLSNYFRDADSPKLNYTILETENIKFILANNSVQIIPDKNYTGEQSTFITANDSKNIAVSNLFTITVVEEPKITEVISPQHLVILNQPVKWVRDIKIDRTVENLSMPISLDATNISITKISQGVEFQVTTNNIKIEYAGNLQSLEDYEKVKQVEKIEKEILRVNNEKQDIILQKDELRQKNIRLIGLAEQRDAITGAVTLQTGSKGIITRFAEWIFLRFNTDITGAVVGLPTTPSETNSTITIEDEIEEFQIEYYTQGPTAVENTISPTKKEVIISSDIHYENILAYTTIKETPAEEIRIRWLVNDTYILIEPEALADSNNNSLIDTVYWIVPSLSNQTYQIIIEISRAEHLDQNRTYLRDIFEYVNKKDNNFTTIPDQDYIRATFEVPLDSSRDITLFAKGNGSVQIFEEGQSFLIAQFQNISTEREYKVYLTNLIGQQDTFDLKISGHIEIDHIIDPLPNSSSASSLSEWTMDGRTLNGTNYYPGPIPPDISILTLTSNNIGVSTGNPLVYDNSLYGVGLRDGIFRLNATNISQQLDKTADLTLFRGPVPAISNNNIYAGNEYGFIYQFNASNLSQILASQDISNAQHYSSPIAYKNFLFATDWHSTGGQGIYQLNASNISQTIAIQSVGSCKSAPAIANDSLYYPCGSIVYQLNASNVSVKQSQFTAGGSFATSDALAVVDNFVYFGTNNDKVYQLNASNVSQKIEEFTTDGDLSTGPAIANGYLYIATTAGTTYQLDSSNISQHIANYSTGPVYQGLTITDDYLIVAGSSIFQLKADDISQHVANYSLTSGRNPSIANGIIYTGTSNSFHQIGTDLPVSYLDAPPDGFGFGASLQNVTFNCTGWDTTSLLNMSLYLTDYTNSSFAHNQSTAKVGQLNSSNWTVPLVEGNYTWNCLIEDNEGNYNWSTNRTLGLDITAPVIEYVTPNPVDNAFTTDDRIELNITIAEQSFKDVIYEWDGKNYTYYNNSVVAMYNFDNITDLGENYGLTASTVTDLSRSENHLTIVGILALNATGRHGSAIELDGSNDYLAIPHDDSLDFGTGGFSINLWMKTNFLESGTMQIIGKRVDGSGNVELQLINNVLESYIQGSGQGTLQVQTTFDTTNYLNEWHFITLNRVGSNLSIFVDGVRNHSGTSIHNVDNSNPFNIGRDVHGGDEFFKGAIDELQILNRGLSDEAVYQMYISNLRKYQSDNWNLFINQSLNTTLTLPDGEYTYRISAEDLNGNQDETTLRTVTVDTSSPTIINITNKTSEYKTAFELNINATDAIGVECFSVNDSANFKINCSGTLENNTILDIYQYHLNITANDSTANEVSEVMWVNVSDTLAPTFTTIVNQSIYDLDALTYNIIATDAANISCFSLNDTDNFKINCTGYLENNTVLDPSVYWLNISINDTENNSNYNLMFVNVTVKPFLGLTLDNPTTNITTNLNEFFNVDVNVSCHRGDCDDVNVSLYNKYGNTSDVRVAFLCYSSSCSDADDLSGYLIDEGFDITIQRYTSWADATLNSSAFDVMVVGGNYLVGYYAFDSASDPARDAFEDEAMPLVVALDTGYTPERMGITSATCSTDSSDNQIIDIQDHNIMSGFSGTVYIDSTSDDLCSFTEAQMTDPYTKLFAPEDSGAAKIAGFVVEKGAATTGTDQGTFVYLGFDTADTYPSTTGNDSQIIKQAICWAATGSSDCSQNQLINKTTGATPFFTNTSNPYNLTLANSTSEIVTWWVNATGELARNFTFYVQTNKTSDESVNNQTIRWNVSIISGSDSILPTIDDINNQTLEFGTALRHDINASDNIAIDCYKVNDSDNFQIDCDGILLNNTILNVAIYNLNITVNDTSDNNKSEIMWVNITPDISPPTFDNINNLTIEYNTSFTHNINASDPSNVSCFTVNDTENFQIDCAGLLQNNSFLDLKNHWLNITANDTLNQKNSEIIFVNITDTVAPLFTSIQNQTIEFETALSYTIQASDPNGLSCFTVNDTANFQITCAGLLENNTPLGLSIYWINITINDTSNRTNNEKIFVNVTDTDAPTLEFTAPTLSNGSVVSDEAIQLNVSIGNLQGPGEIISTWNKTNFTYFNNSLVLMFNFENITSIGENYAAGTSNKTIDLSTYKNNGTLHGVTYNSSSPYGSGFEFDGSGGFIDVGNDPSLNLGDSFTLSAWTYVFEHDGDYSFIITKDGSSGGSYDLGFKASKPYLAINDGSWAEYVSNSALTTEVWHHIVGVRDAANNAHIYIDGILNKSFSSVKSPQAVTTNLYIGRRVSTDYEHNGIIDEPRIWNISMSSQEVYQLYASNLKKTDTNIWNLYINQSFNTTTILTDGNYTYQTFASDQSGNSQNTEQRTTTIDNTAPIFTNISNITSEYGLSLRFDINASDAREVACFTVNDTTNFKISCSGVLENNLDLTSKQYWINVSVNDTANNTGAQSIWINITDTTAPIFTTIANQTVEFNTSFTYAITATDASNISCFHLNNSNFQINCTGYLQNNTILDLNLYWFNITVNDTLNNTNAEIMFVNVTDTTKPIIHTVDVTPTIGLKGTIFNVSVNTSDNHNVSTVTAYIQKPDENSSLNITLGLLNGLYNGSWNSSSQSSGTYVLDIIVNDTSGNYQEQENGAIVALSTHSINTSLNSSVRFRANRSIIVNSTNRTGTWIKISSGISKNASVGIAQYSNNTKESTPTTVTELKKYIDIIVDPAINQNITTATVRIYYTDEEIEDSDLRESTLRLYKYNENATEWDLLDPGGVEEDLNYVWGNVTSFSSFGVFGTENVEPGLSTTTSSDSSTSGSHTSRSTCTPRWDCSIWGPCSIDSTQLRSCIRRGTCGSGVPVIQQSCMYSPPQDPDHTSPHLSSNSNLIGKAFANVINFTGRLNENTLILLLILFTLIGAYAVKFKNLKLPFKINNKQLKFQKKTTKKIKAVHKNIQKKLKYNVRKFKKKVNTLKKKINKKLQ